MEHMRALVDRLRRVGVVIERGEKGLAVSSSRRLEPVVITTQPYPGFPTDLQAQMMALMTRAEGASSFHETVFENRMLHASELMRLGAHIKVDGSTAVVRGPAELSGAPVMATDLRASVSHVLAGLSAHGETLVSRVYHLDRGYERLEEKLKALGAWIRRVRA